MRHRTCSLCTNEHDASSAFTIERWRRERSINGVVEDLFPPSKRRIINNLDSDKMTSGILCFLGTDISGIVSFLQFLGQIPEIWFPEFPASAVQPII